MLLMGGLPCAKTVIDQLAALRQRIRASLAAMDKGLDCMAASIQLGGIEGKSPTEKQQEAFITTGEKLTEQLDQSCEEMLKVAADIQASVEPTG